MKCIAFVSLGCDKNLVDSELALGSLLLQGYNTIVPLEKAEWIFLNTCAFIRPSCRETEGWIRKLVRLKKRDPRKKIVVLGCYVERFREKAALKYKDIDYWIGVHDLPRLTDILNRGRRGVFLGSPPSVYHHDDPRVLSTPPHYAYVKVAEGCSHRCSFCLIPALRGPLRSRTIDSIVEETCRLAERGVSEIILVAQDLTAYGLDLYGARSLPSLLWELGKVLPENIWIRLLYLAPEGVDEALVEALASVPQVVKYLDVPLQHVDPWILRRMSRPFVFEHTRERLTAIREHIPQVFLRTTFMVGFPGEEEGHFERLVQFVRDFRFERMGAFMYSDEEGTEAFTLQPKVPEEVKRKRYALLMETQKEVAEKVHQGFKGRVLTVVLDEELCRGGERFFWGRTQGDAPEVDCRVKVRVREGLFKPGMKVPVRITSTSAYELEGEVL
ncbi:MAG: 30S ribosomal protein S12 methylthiotransferase RimO [Candidatus Caldatribacteriaceae bacterium]